MKRAEELEAHDEEDDDKEEEEGPTTTPPPSLEAVLADWRRECAAALSGEPHTALDSSHAVRLVGSLARGWSPFVLGNTCSIEALDGGPRGLLALAEASGTPAVVWGAVARDLSIPPALFKLAREGGPVAAAASQQCLALCCAAPEAREDSAATATTGLFADGHELCAWAVAECCARYDDAATEEDLAWALLVACGVHAAFRGSGIDVATELRALPDLAEELGNALVMLLNRSGTVADFFGVGSSSACIALVSDLVEPPCLFPPNDLRIIVDVALREIVDAPRGLPDVRSFAELLAEIVQSDWYASEPHRKSDILAITSAAAEAFNDPGLAFLTRQISKSLNQETL
jgi:hypothetical protein